MKKEILISILVGFGIGLIITFFIYSSSKIKNPVFESPVSGSLTPYPLNNLSPSAFQSLQNISLITPIDQSIVKEPKTTVSGTTTPGSTIIILWDKGEKVLTANNKGNFETEISLDSGENEIEIQSYSDTGEKVSKTVTIVYTTAEI